MTWTSPPTFIAGTALTAAQLNTFLRDNLNQTAPARATATGRLFVSTGAHTIAERPISAASIGTFESTSASAFADLLTVGPSISLTTGAQAVVIMATNMKPQTTVSSGRGACAASFTVTGATTIAANEDRQLRYSAISASDTGTRRSSVHWISNLAAGVNVFTMKYAVRSDSDGSSTGLFGNRTLIVVAV